MFKAQNRYKECCYYEAIKAINKILGPCRLTEEQEKILREELQYRRSLQIYSWQTESVRGNNWAWRFTLPLFFIFVVILNLIVFPIHWIFTGKYSLGEDSKILSLGYNWHDKIFKWRI